MASKPRTAADQARERLVSRVSGLFAAAVVLQALVFIVLSRAYWFAENAAVSAFAGAGGQGAVTLQAALLVVGFLFELFLALLVGFYGSRLLARWIARSIPPGKKAPLAPMPVAAICAAAIIIAFSLIESAAARQPLGAFAWLLLLLRDACVGVLIWYAAQRALAPKAA